MFSDILHFNINGVGVYAAQFDETVEVQPVLPPARQQFIERCSSDLHKRQSYCVWQLLDYALRERLGYGVDKLNFTVDGNGKWSCEGCGVHFSLSHCASVVAVAVAEHPVGIDVEAVDGRCFNARLAQRILTENERAIYNNVTQAQKPQMLAEAWTKKESLFKRDGGKNFAPSAIDTCEQKVACKTLTFGNKTLVVAVAFAQ